MSKSVWDGRANRAGRIRSLHELRSMFSCACGVSAHLRSGGEGWLRCSRANHVQLLLRYRWTVAAQVQAAVSTAYASTLTVLHARPLEYAHNLNRVNGETRGARSARNSPLVAGSVAKLDTLGPSVYVPVYGSSRFAEVGSAGDCPALRQHRASSHPRAPCSPDVDRISPRHR